MSDVPLVRSQFYFISPSLFPPSSSDYGIDGVCANQIFQLFGKQGFGVTARSTLDTRKLDPTGIIVFHQADVGEFLRDEDTMF